MPTPSRDIVIRLIGDGTSLSSTLSKSVGDLTATERKLQDVGRRMASIGDTMTATLTGPLVLAAGGAIKASSDLAEAVNVTARIFGDASDDIGRAAEQSAESVGLSERAYREAAASVGGLLANLGFAQEETVAWSQELVTLGADLGSAFNEDPAQAVEAIGSALRGETEPIRRFNVMLSDADVRLRAVELGLANSTAEVDANAKAQATLNLITEQTAAVQGDFAATADGMANSSRILKANVEDLAAELGESLLPFAEDVLAMLNGVVGAFADLPEGTQRAILAFGGLLAAMGPVLSVGGRLVGMFGQMGSLLVASGPWGVAAAGALTVLGSLAQAFTAAQQEAQALNEAIEADGAALADNTREIIANNVARRDLGDQLGVLGLNSQDLTAAILGEADALNRINDAVADGLQLGVELGEVDSNRAQAAMDVKVALENETGAINEQRDALNEEALAASRASAEALAFNEAVRSGTSPIAAFNQLARDSAVSVDEFGNATDEAVEPTDELTLSLEDLGDTLRGFADPIGAYTDLLEDKQSAERDAATVAAEATADQTDSWEDFYTDVTVSAEEWISQLEEQVAAQADWAANMERLAGRVSETTINELARLGPEGAPLVAELVDASDAELSRLDDVMATQVDASITAMSDRIEGSREIARRFGSETVDSMVSELQKGTLSAAEIARSYAEALRTGVNPILIALGKPEIVSVTGGPGGITEFNTGGLIPGSGPNVDTVPAMLTTGEYVIQRPAVQRQPQAAWDALNDGRATIVPHDTRNVPPVDTYNAGGLVGYPALVDYMRRSGVPHSVTSTLRPGDPGAHGRGLAADFSIAGHGNRGYGSPGLARIFNTLAPLGAGKIRQLILAAAPQILRNFPSTWGRPGSRGNHWNHVHGAMQPGVSLTGVPAIGGAAGPYGYGISLPGLPSHSFTGAVGRPLDATMEAARTAAQEFVDANSFDAVMGSASLSGNRAANRDLARRLLAAYGWGDHWTAFDRLAMGESGYNNLAQNPTSTAFGIGQFLNSTWASVGGRKTSDPAEQLRLMFRYIEQRYGNPTQAFAAWNRRSPHWYNEGGMVGSPDNPHIRDAGGPLMPGFTFNGTGVPETVVGPSGVVDVNVVRVTAPDVSPPDGPDVVGPDDFLPRPAPPGGALSPELYDQILRNREQARIDALTNTEHLLEVQQHIVDLEAEGLKYTDEWVAALEQAKQIEADISAEARRRGEAIHDAAVQQRRLAEQAQAEADRLQDTLGTQLDQLLDRKATLDRQTADATGRYADAVADAQLRASQDIDRLIASRNDTLFGSFGPLDQQFTAQWGATAGALTRNIQDQVDLFDEWADGIDELRSRGVSEDLIASLGLDDPAQLGQVRLLLAANRTELEQLDQALSARRSQTAEQVADESSMLLGALGTAISDVRTSLAATLNELEEGLADQLSVIGDQMAALGMDAGRSYADRMTEALESGLPGIIGLAEQYRQAFDDAQSAAEAAAQLVVPPPASSPGISTIDRAMLIGAAPNTWSASRTVVLRVGEREFTAYVEDTARGAARTDSFRGALQGTSS